MIVTFVVPSSKESVEWVSMMGLDRGGFVLVKENDIIRIHYFNCISSINLKLHHSQAFYMKTSKDL